MKIRETHRHEEKIELQMAPMIDIVFQLLIFFIMTFKITAMEGDFNIKMPKGAKPSENRDFEPPMTIELQSDSEGDIADIILKRPSGDVSLRPNPFEAQKLYQRLSEEIIAYVGTGPEQGDAASSTEIIFDCDEYLRYEEAVNAITAVTGYINEEGELVTLVENVKFREH